MESSARTKLKESAVTDEIRVAIVRSHDGHVTVCGPRDYSEKDHPDAMSAATCWMIEAGWMPAHWLWATIELPPLPAPDEIRAAAKVGAIPPSMLEFGHD